MHIAYTTAGTLIPGIHTMTLADFKNQFGMATRQRQYLFEKLERGLNNLRKAGVKVVYLDGSFVTRKAHPGDIDGCWDASPEIDLTILDSVFLDFEQRHLMKEKYGVDFFISQTIEGASGKPFTDFFQTDRNGVEKGIVRLLLEHESFEGS